MRITVIKDDKRILVDGKTVDCPDISYPDDLHAIQWYGTYGEKELKNPIRNEKITDFGEVKPYYDEWVRVKEKKDAEREEELKAYKESWDYIRDERAPLLFEADVAINRKEDLGKNSKAWREYRQALRDIPQNFVKPAKVQWPRKPG